MHNRLLEILDLRRILYSKALAQTDLICNISSAIDRNETTLGVILDLCWLVNWILLCVSLKNLVVRAACVVVPLNLIVPSIFVYVYDWWSSLSVSR